MSETMDAPTDAQHDWISQVCGIDPRTTAASTDSADAVSATAAGAAADSDSGGIWGAIKGAASSVVDTAANVASDVGHTVADAAGGVVDTVGNVASDIGQTVSDAAGGVVNTVETAAEGVGHTVADAGGGLWDTAKKVAGDVGSGHLGDALGDAADGVVSTTGRVASDAAHAVIDTGSAALDAAGKVVTDTQQTVADAATGVINTAGNVVGDVAHTVSDAAGPDSMIGQAAGAVGSFAHAAAGAAVDTVKTVTDLNKGIVEGVVGGVEGLAKGVVNLADSAGKEAYALATDETAREQALDTVEHGAEAVGRFAETAVTDPGKAASEVGDAVESGAATVGKMAENVYGQYQQAAAAGHGAEFIGKGLGQGAVLVAGAVLTDGASVAAEGGAVAAEGAAVVGELGEGASALGELGEGAGALGEEAGAATRGVSTAEDATTAAAAPPGPGATLADTTDVAADSAASGEGYVDIGEDPELQATAQEVDEARPDLDVAEDDPATPRRDVSREQARREANSGAARVREEQEMTDPDVQAGHTQAARHTPESGAPREQVNDPDTFQHLHSRRGKGLDVDVTDQEGVARTTTRHRAQEGLIDDAVDRSRVGGQLTPEGQQAAGDEVLWRTDGTGFDQREVQMKRDSGLFDENAAIERMRAGKAAKSAAEAPADAAALQGETASAGPADALDGPPPSASASPHPPAGEGSGAVAEPSEMDTAADSEIEGAPPKLRVRVSAEEPPVRVRIADGPAPRASVSPSAADEQAMQDMAEEEEAMNTEPTRPKRKRFFDQ